jgi:PPE family
MPLNIDTDSLRRTGELVDTAATLLAPQLGADVPPCGGDEVSKAVMDNLNAWQRWLMQHVRAGSQQALAAAAGIAGTAGAYEAEDLAAAARYPDGGSGAGAAPAAPTPSVPAAPPAPSGPPTLSPIPDISGQDGEQIALALESGAGPGPALAAATQLTGLATQAGAAQTALMAAQTQLLASGESAVSGPLMTRLTRAITWTQGVAGHAGALASGYTAAAGLHTTTKTAVGHSADWRATKNGYAEAVWEQGFTGFAGQAKVHAYQARLAGMQQSAGIAMTGYQTTGQTASTPPGTLPEPGLNPNAENAPGPTPDPTPGDANNELDDKDPATPAADDQSGSQGMLSQLMSALGPLLQSAGQANPLQSLGSLGQVGQQLSQQASKAAQAASSPIKPAALAKPHLAAAHKGGGGGGSPIKPASISGAVHPASLTGTPASTPIKPAAAAKGATPSQGGGMGMMPMGQRAGAGSKSSKVNSYEQPLPEVESTGRPGVIGDTAKPEPVVKPEAQNAVKARLAARKKDASPTTDT